MITLKILWPWLKHGREANVSSGAEILSWLWYNFGSQSRLVGLGSRMRCWYPSIKKTTRIKSNDPHCMSFQTCHIWLFLCLKKKPLAFPATGQEFSDREDREDMIRVLKKLLDHDSPGVPEPSSNDDHDGACPDAYLMRTPFKVWRIFFVAAVGGVTSGYIFCVPCVSAGDDLLFQETFWWHFWGPAFHYAGTGAYLVKAGGNMGNVGDSPTPYFRWIWAWPYYVPCCFMVDSVKVLTNSFTKCRSWERSQQRPPSK